MAAAGGTSSGGGTAGGRLLGQLAGQGDRAQLRRAGGE